MGTGCIMAFLGKGNASFTSRPVYLDHLCSHLISCLLHKLNFIHLGYLRKLHVIQTLICIYLCKPRVASYFWLYYSKIQIHFHKISAMKGLFDEMGKHSVVLSPSNYKISVLKKKKKRAGTNSNNQKFVTP